MRIYTKNPDFIRILTDKNIISGSLAQTDVINAIPSYDTLSIVNDALTSQIKTEADARIAAVKDEETSRINALTAEANARKLSDENLIAEIKQLANTTDENFDAVCLSIDNLSARMKGNEISIDSNYSILQKKIDKSEVSSLSTDILGTVSDVSSIITADINATSSLLSHDLTISIGNSIHQLYSISTLLSNALTSESDIRQKQSDNLSTSLTSLIESKVSTTYKYCGTFSSYKNLVNSASIIGATLNLKQGDVYNVIIDDNFDEPSSYLSGSNYAWVSADSSLNLIRSSQDPVVRSSIIKSCLDRLGGVFNTSIYYPKSETSSNIELESKFNGIDKKFDDYYLKSETSGKLELESKFINLSNSYYLKSETSSSSQISSGFADLSASKIEMQKIHNDIASLQTSKIDVTDALKTYGYNTLNSGELTIQSSLVDVVSSSIINLNDGTHLNITGGTTIIDKSLLISKNSSILIERGENTNVSVAIEDADLSINNANLYVNGYDGKKVEITQTGNISATGGIYANKISLDNASVKNDLSVGGKIYSSNGIEVSGEANLSTLHTDGSIDANG